IAPGEPDTTHVNGHCPAGGGLEGCDAPALGGLATPPDTADWRELLPRAKLRADARHRFVLRRPARVPVTHVRLNIFPDGGLARLRLWGRPVDLGGAPRVVHRLKPVLGTSLPLRVASPRAPSSGCEQDRRVFQWALRARRPRGVAALLRRAALGGRDARRPPVRERRRVAGTRRARLVGARAGGLARSVRAPPTDRRADRGTVVAAGAG